MSINLVYEAVEGIKEQADELLAKKDCATDFERGLLFAYADALGIIKSAFAGYSPEDINLDFDIDKRYLL